VLRHRGEANKNEAKYEENIVEVEIRGITLKTYICIMP
jgi:hypothetical protein